MAGAMGAALRGRKNCLAKIKHFIYSFLNLYFAPHTIINCKAASTWGAHSTGLLQMQTPKQQYQKYLFYIKNPYICGSAV